MRSDIYALEAALKPGNPVRVDAAYDEAPGQAEATAFDHANFFAGVLMRRAFAYLIDLVAIGAAMAVAAFAFLLFGAVTLGLLSPLLVVVYGLIPLAYHTYLVGGPRSATLGMRAMNVEVRTLDGGRPAYLQAMIVVVLFYLSLMVWPILAVGLFNDRRRLVHDMLAGTVVINARAQMVLSG